MAGDGEKKVEAAVEENKEEKKVEEGEEKKEEKEAANAPKPKVGDIYECRYPHPKGDRWFEAKVLEIIEKDGVEKKYKMEWQYDPDEEKSVVPVSDLRFPPGKEPVPAKKEGSLTPEVGEIYEARFAHRKGDRWFEAKVLEIVTDGGVEKYKMEWQYDPDEEKSTLPVSDLRLPPGKKPAKKEELLIPKVGDIFEARFAHPKGDRWFEAKVLEIVKDRGVEKYKMEWQYDPDEEKSVLPLADLRKVGSAKKDGGGKQGGGRQRSGGKQWEQKIPEKRKVVYVVEAAEEERRKRRAARFGAAA